MKFKFGLLFSLVLTFLFVTTCSSKLQKTKVLLEKGKIYQNSININGNIVPLEEGEWYLVSHEVNTKGFIEIRFFKMKGNKLHSKVTIVSKDVSSNKKGYVESKAYLKPNIYFIEQTSNNRGGKQECWLVNYITDEKFTPNTNIDRETIQFIQSRSIIVPKTMIQSYHHFAGVNNYLNVTYYYNPEIEGFEPDNDASQSVSAWSYAKIQLDENKAKYIEKIKNKGSHLHSLLKEGLADN